MYRGNVSRSMDGDCKRRGKWSGNADQPKESRCWVLHLKSILRDLPVDFKKRIRVNTNKKTEGLSALCFYFRRNSCTTLVPHRTVKNNKKASKIVRNSQIKNDRKNP